MKVARDCATKDGRPFVVREATPGDAQQLLAGARAVIGERLDYLITRPREFAYTVEQEVAWIQAHIDADNSLILVAEAAGSIIGWVELRGGARLRTRHTAELGITVARPWRERGVGQALMQALIDWATGNPDLDKLKLLAVAGNERALHLYRKLGFQEEGRLPREFKRADGSYLDGILMYRFV